MMTSRKGVSNPEGLAAPIYGYYSNAVRVTAGDLLFIAGQVAWDSEGRVVGEGDIRAQTRQTLENIRTIMKVHGRGMGDILKVTVYVTDMSHFREIAEVRMEYFPADGPASTIVEVSQLAFPELMIEIDAVAAV